MEVYIYTEHLSQLVNRKIYNSYNRGRTSINFKEDFGMNKLAKFGIKAVGFVGSIMAATLIANGTNKLIGKFDGESSENEEDSTTDKDEAE